MTNSKECPHCKTRNNPSFSWCWKCRYSFIDGMVIDDPPTDIADDARVLAGAYYFQAVPVLLWVILLVFMEIFDMATQRSPDRPVGILYILMLLGPAFAYVFSGSILRLKKKCAPVVTKIISFLSMMFWINQLYFFLARTQKWGEDVLWAITLYSCLALSVLIVVFSFIIFKRSEVKELFNR